MHILYVVRHLALHSLHGALVDQLEVDFARLIDDLKDSDSNELIAVLLRIVIRIAGLALRLRGHFSASALALIRAGSLLVVFTLVEALEVLLLPVSISKVGDAMDSQIESHLAAVLPTVDAWLGRNGR